MPPRRSTRASAEPSSQQPQPVKRKRTDAKVIEEEPESKPPPRRSSAKPVPASKKRVPSRVKVSALPEEAEDSDDGMDEIEEIEMPPPRKRARPSKEVAGTDDEDEVKEVRPRTSKAASLKGKVSVAIGKKGGRGSTAPESAISRSGSGAPGPSVQAKGTRSSKAEVEEENSDPKEELPSRSKRMTKANVQVKKEDGPAGSRGRRAGSAKPASSTKPVTQRESGRVSKSIDIVSEDEEEEPTASKKVSKKGMKAEPSLTIIPDSEDEIEELPPPPAKQSSRRSKPPSRSGARPPSRTGTSRSKKPVVEETLEESELEAEAEAEKESDVKGPGSGTDSEEEEAEVEALSAAVMDDGDSTPGAAQQDELEEEADEEEKSLLETKPAVVLPNTQMPSIPEEPEKPKSRLVIHKMALINFKSYAGRQEIGPFHKSFSSIVGPNGSGKSNTIDALLFVFGYRASKMRQAKLSELIHNSARHPDLDTCSVEVHFREIIDLPGPDAYKVVPGSDLVVTRQAFRNNSSRYTINKQQSNYTEVQTLLKSRGIDLDHKRFLILQGEVESIAQMKPKAQTEHDDGLLEYLEDIIGTSKFKAPIEEALQEMDALQEDRAEKMNRVRIVEREKNALEEKKKEAEDYLKLQNEHVRAVSRLWQWYLWRCLLLEEQLESKMAELEKELAKETEQNKDDIEHLKLLEDHFDERKAAYKEVQAAAIEVAKELADHEKKQVSVEERRKHANTKAKKLKKSVQEEQHTQSEALRTLKENADKIEREKTKLEEHETSLEKEEKVLEGIQDSLRDKTQVFHDQIEVKQKELQPWTAKINSKEAEINVATSERDALVKKAEAVKEASKEAEEALDGIRQEQQAKAEEHSSLKDQKANMQNSLKDAREKHAAVQESVQSLRSKASTARQKVDEAKATQAANTTQNRVLDSLTRLKNSKSIQGFHGRLGSLGTIPDKYDVAISTACGSLNNMVVDTVQQGQHCIEYLRSQNIGRASFMVLEKLSVSSGMDKITTPENVPRLFDLIKPKDAKFAPAFYKAISNTLVANDLDQANRIAFGSAKRWRVVTLAGQLIDSSGTMSGGGNTVARGGMSSKLAADAVSPEELRGYEQESQKAAQQLEEAVKASRAAEAKVEELLGLGPKIDIALEKLELDVQNGTKRITEAEKRVRDLKSQSKPDAKDAARISALEREIESSSAELSKLQEKSGKIEGSIKDLEKQILEIGGSKLLTQKSKVDGIRLRINLANDEITKAEVAKAKAEKDIKKLETTIEANAALLEEVTTELEDLNRQYDELSEYMSQISSKVEAAQQAEEHSKEDLETLKVELDAKTVEVQAFRQKEMEIVQKVSEAKKEAKENENTLNHYRTEHDKLKLEDVDSDDEDDEDEAEAEAEAEAESSEQAKAERVKEEPVEQEASRKKPRNRTPSDELHIYSAEELAKFKKREMIADAELLDEKLKTVKPNLGVLREYRKREEEFFRRAKDLEDVTNRRDAQKQAYDGLRKQRLDGFMGGFSLISLKLKEMYQMITLGGNAELELVDSMDPFSEGIIFSVMPPKKSWKNISNLSGGEKTLSSLALVFALHVFKPTPLYFMDEIDAALDFRNVSIVANYIKDRTKNAQFIIISLRNDMFELSHRLIGIYKTSNATQSVSIDNKALTRVPVKSTPVVT